MSKFVRAVLTVFWMIVSTQAHVQAQEDPDLSALVLADKTTVVADKPSNWRVFTEGALSTSELRADRTYQPDQRFSLDVQYDNSFATGWRGVFSDRFDTIRPVQYPANTSINTLKEAYLSWQIQSDQLVDMGRINVRNGVALGYNPTDYFKVNAIRSLVSLDPGSLKENRQGSAMVRAQQLWDSASVTLLYSPKFATSSANATNLSSFNLDAAATNGEQRWLLSYSQKLSEGLNPQWLIFKSEQQPVQLGFNLSSLLNDATVFYLEWSGGKNTSLLHQILRQQALPYSDDTSLRHQFASGITYNTDNKIALSIEFDYNGRGLSGSSWESLGQQSLVTYAAYRFGLQNAQDLPTKEAAMVYGSWQDAMVNHLDLTAMERIDLIDSSRLTWLEARYHWSQTEFALQWQRYSGRALSDFGSAPQVQAITLLGRLYF